MTKQQIRNVCWPLNHLQQYYFKISAQPKKKSEKNVGSSLNKLQLFDDLHKIVVLHVSISTGLELESVQNLHSAHHGLRIDFTITTLWLQHSLILYNRYVTRI